MITLHGRLERLSGGAVGTDIFSVTHDGQLGRASAASKAYLSLNGEAPDGFRVVLHRGRPPMFRTDATHLLLTDQLDYLNEGDVIRLDLADGSFRVLFRKGSRHNSILLTEQCNHYCLMCSQPPKDLDDSWILEEARRLIRLVPLDTPEIGFTGGEPTLYGAQFVDLLRLTKETLPRTTVHILSNGRAFKDIEFARSYAAVDHHDVMVGIPLYSDDPVRHDYVVQWHYRHH